MHKFLTIFCALSSLLLITESCKSTKDQAVSKEEVIDEQEVMDDVVIAMEDENLEQIAGVRLGSPYEILWNDSKNFALVTKKVKIRSNDPYPTIRFLVYDKQQQEVIYENTEPGGKVVWNSNEVIHVSSAIGIPNPNASNKNPREYKYHVVNRKKYNGKFFKNQ